MLFARLSTFLMKREHEVILFSLCAVAIAFSFLNPLWFGQAPGFDASVFAVIGKMWANGGVLYRDMIDIKGPGIFFTDMIGYRIGGFPGIAFVDTIFLVAGVICMDLALRVFRLSPLARFCSITVVMSIMGFRYYYGNMTEDYSLYLSMMATYPFALMFGLRRFYWKMGLIVAILFAFTFSFRVNNTALFCAWYAMLFLFFAHLKNWKGCLGLILTTLVGFAFVFGCFASYFYVNGGTQLLKNAAYYSFLIFFSHDNYGVSTAFSLMPGLTGLIRTGLWIVLVGFILVINRKDNRLILDSEFNDRWWFVLYLVFGVIFTVIANSVSGHIFDHYDELYLPLMIIPLAFLMHRYLHVVQDINISFLTIVFLLVFLVNEHIFWSWDHHEWAVSKVLIHSGWDTLAGFIVCAVLFFIRQKIGIYRHNHTFFLCLSILIAFMLGIYAIAFGHESGKPWNDDTAQKVEIIDAETQPSDKIWVVGDMPQYYVWTDRQAASPYLFFGNVHPGFDVMQQVLNNITYYQPKFIVIKTRLIEAYRDGEINETLKNSYSYSEIDFYNFVSANYEEVMPGLFRRKSSGAENITVGNNEVEQVQQQVVKEKETEEKSDNSLIIGESSDQSGNKAEKKSDNADDKTNKSESIKDNKADGSKKSDTSANAETDDQQSIIIEEVPLPKDSKTVEAEKSESGK